MTGSQSPPQAALAGLSTNKTRLPAVNADRCVHAHIGHARCHACADACPHEAWIIDDERLSLDTNTCDGCGLCIPACPEGAISHSQEPGGAGIRSWNDHPSVFRACEPIGLATCAEIVPCLHATGAGELLRRYRQGVRVWITAINLIKSTLF